MAAPAIASFSRLTRGYAQIPNNLIENLGSFTHAELVLALIVLRRGGARSEVSVSDRNWQGWSGLSPRLKEYAINGLKRKCLSVSGRGEGARFVFEPQTWEQFVKSPERRQRPHTAGRRQGVKPATGAKIHSDCRARGCAMLAAENSQCPVVSIDNAQPVAQTSGDHESENGLRGSPPEASTPRELRLARTELTSAAPSSDAQPVAQTVAAEFPRTLAKLHSVSAVSGARFLARLVAAVRKVAPDVTDSQLLAGLSIAHISTAGRRKSDGLFLHTVPEAVLRVREAPPAAPEPPYVDPVESFRTAKLPAIVESLRALGSRFEGYAFRLLHLFRAGGPVSDLAGLDDKLAELGTEIAAEAAQVLDAGQASAVQAAVEEDLKRHYGRGPAYAGPGVRDRLRERHTLRVLGVPRLALVE